MKTLGLLAVVCLSLAYGGTPTNGEEDPPAVKQRIVGGRPAREGEFPYLVALRPPRSIKHHYKHAFCGGSIIDEKWVLTAAHCFWGKKKDGKMGYINTADTAEVIPGGLTKIATEMAIISHIPLEKVIVHPHYNPSNDENDIALLKVKGNLLADGKAKPIPLAKPNQGNFIGSPAILAGYGRTDNDSPKTSKLLMMTDNMKVLPHSDCEIYGQYREDMMVCAGDMKGGHGACRGDSGSPLVVVVDNERVVVGVTSFQKKHACGAAKKPSVYARVSHYDGFIQDVLSEKITEGKKESLVSGLLHKLFNK